MELIDDSVFLSFKRQTDRHLLSYERAADSRRQRYRPSVSLNAGDHE